jgi:hypothetical protein
VGSSIYPLHDENCLPLYIATLAALPDKDSFFISFYAPLFVESDIVQQYSGVSNILVPPKFITHIVHDIPHVSTHFLISSFAVLRVSTCLSVSCLDVPHVSTHFVVPSLDVLCVSTCFLVSPFDAAHNAVLSLHWLSETNPKPHQATNPIAWTPIPDVKTAPLHARADKLIHFESRSRMC